MRRVAIPLATLLALLTFAVARPVAQRHGEGAAVFHLLETTVADIQHAVQTGLISSEQLVRMYLARIAAYDDDLPGAAQGINAYIHINANVVQQARQMDAQRHPGRARKPLDGIPVGLKDIIDTGDMPT